MLKIIFYKVLKSHVKLLSFHHLLLTKPDDMNHKSFRKEELDKNRCAEERCTKNVLRFELMIKEKLK